MAYIWMTIAYLIDVLFMSFFGEKLLDSDMASEMILSDILNSEKSITGLTHSWYYSTEIRVLEMQWFYRIGLLLSPKNWHMARTIGMALALIVFVVAIVLMFNSLGMKDAAKYGAAIALMPGGSWYFWQTLYGGYYLPYVIIAFFTMTLSVAIVRNKERVSGSGKGKVISSKHQKIKQFGMLTVIALLGLLSGMNGVKQLMVFYAPFVLATGFMLLYGIRKETIKQENLFKTTQMRMFGLAGLSTFFSFIGYLINSKVLACSYYFQQFGDTKINGRTVLDCLRYYIWSFGFANGKQLLSFKGIASMIGLLIGVVTVVSAICLIRRFNALCIWEQYLTAISISIIVFCIFIFSYVGGEIQYFQSAVPWGLFLIVLELKTEKYVFVASRKILLNLAFIMLLFTSVGTLANQFDENTFFDEENANHMEKVEHNFRARPGYDEVLHIVEDNGYTQGVARFWDGNLLTELSDGNIEMWILDEYQADDIDPWLQKVAHSNGLPEGRYFFVAKNDDQYYEFTDRHPEISMIYQDDRYVVFGN
ncbi:hypothetical protein SAMN04487928_10186 [Butyrivibrio proteoclasticus]|uniref:Glycosyltransferase RgtA/B/C/D-like domain-containing protein n=1 Tax=Butyrivibrio proteoclasticus TaxID=43305 RepID=A0A1I5PP27_9FIRM|nr:hypothetical protein [Butyrivibrio proteoclasticus]SFP35823.1 hypothetical protein SAMN04487928_10186 [Butyrivibrio proteoclasticus]